MNPHQIDEKRAKGVCFNYEKKCSKGHKSSENKLFYIDYEDEEYEGETSQNLEIE